MNGTDSMNNMESAGSTAGSVTVRPRLRDLGILIGGHQPGEHNAITDVPGVRVGHHTLRRPPDLHTGVTAVVPGEVRPSSPLPAGMFAGNGYGKLVGATQLVELGLLETPIVLTSTLSAFLAADALVGWMLDRPGCEQVRSLNPVVGECNDGYLSDIRSRSIRAEHVYAALDDAVGGPVPMGCVGAGTGTAALGFKAGIGSSSRRLRMARPAEAARTVEAAGVAGAGESLTRTVTVGTLVQANFGGTLRIHGREVPAAGTEEVGGAGSCVIVVATDAPLDARQLARVARRAVFGLGRVGATYANGSGDYGIAFSTVVGRPLPDPALDVIFEATLDIVEEAVLDSLLQAVPTTGQHGRRIGVLDPAVFQPRPSSRSPSSSS